MSAALIAYLRPNPARKCVEAFQQFLDVQLRKRWIARNGFVEVVHLSLVMSVMVDLHRLSINVRFQGVVCIGKRGQGERRAVSASNGRSRSDNSHLR